MRPGPAPTPNDEAEYRPFGGSGCGPGQDHPGQRLPPIRDEGVRRDHGLKTRDAVPWGNLLFHCFLRNIRAFCCPNTAYAVESDSARENPVEKSEKHYISFDIKRHAQDIVQKQPFAMIRGEGLFSAYLILSGKCFLPHGCCRPGAWRTDPWDSFSGFPGSFVRRPWPADRLWP